MQLSKIIEEMINEPSPIRQIMKMASRQNIINMGLNPDEVISYGGGWVGHHSPEELQNIYEKISSDISLFHDSGAYSPTAGFDEAREALAKMEKYLFNVNAGMENVIIGQSSTQITHDLFITLANDGDKIMLFDPTYANYPGQIKIALRNAKIVRLTVIDEERWEYKDGETLSEEFKELYEREKPKIVLFPSPDNPSSQIFPHKFVETVADECEDSNSFMLLDYAYKTQVFGTIPQYFSWSPEEKPFMIGIYSNSKWGRGLGRRLAWIIADEEIINGMERTQQCTILCPDTMHQMAITEYINDGIKNGSLKRYLDEVRDAYRKAAEITVNSIEEYLGLPHLVPQGGLYTLMKVNEDGDKFVERVLRNTGVLFIPGRGFGESLREAVRISYGPHVENTDIIKEGFKRVAEYLHGKDK